MTGYDGEELSRVQLLEKMADIASPTEFVAVFNHQIGLGLRLAEGKSHCVIINLNGNYRNAYTKLTVFTPDSTNKVPLKTIQTSSPELCAFNLETEIIELVKEMAKNAASHNLRLIYEISIKRRIGH
ncbi:hypothetical protein SAMN05518871_107159 [Psychrobacillus sp. OK028]|uniref:hypothetical protein n=1 Tax=Psychrobacillus sp. OK028 TaxID=1884359 RepID=UPI00088356E6|nr:hypothetical protein [Psychrobacillus sp. OK028]SDN76528.1 hypothetical protein SAMN05518871_107159 [Psychrobacillus sp. OK028]